MSFLKFSNEFNQTMLFLMPDILKKLMCLIMVDVFYISFQHLAIFLGSQDLTTNVHLRMSRACAGRCFSLEGQNIESLIHGIAVMSNDTLSCHFFCL